MHLKTETPFWGITSEWLWVDRPWGGHGCSIHLFQNCSSTTILEASTDGRWAISQRKVLHTGIRRCCRILRRKASDVCVAGSGPPTAAAFKQRKINHQQVRTSFSPQIYLPGNESSANTAVKHQCSLCAAEGRIEATRQDGEREAVVGKEIWIFAIEFFSHVSIFFYTESIKTWGWFEGKLCYKCKDFFQVQSFI